MESRGETVHNHSPVLAAWLRWIRPSIGPKCWLTPAGASLMNCDVTFPEEDVLGQASYDCQGEGTLVG